MTSSVSPALSRSLAQVENTPSCARLIATRSRPSCAAEQIEYERRTSWPSMSALSVRCWPGA
jgi:hypothetical protein